LLVFDFIPNQVAFGIKVGTANLTFIRDSLEARRSFGARTFEKTLGGGKGGVGSTPSSPSRASLSRAETLPIPPPPTPPTPPIQTHMQYGDPNPNPNPNPNPPPPTPPTPPIQTHMQYGDPNPNPNPNPKPAAAHALHAAHTDAHAVRRWKSRES
jgi:hypothetical protein